MGTEEEEEEEEKEEEKEAARCAVHESGSSPSLRVGLLVRRAPLL